MSTARTLSLCTALRMQSLLAEAHWVSLLQPFLWAEEELRLTSLSKSALEQLREPRRYILGGISLWFELLWEHEKEEYEASQLHAIWDREWRHRTGDSDSEYSI